MKPVVLLLIVTLNASAALALDQAPKADGHRSTDIRFTGTDVGGKYQSAGEAIATVEKEKPLLDIIEPRREFKDRLRKSVSQR